MASLLKILIPIAAAIGGVFYGIDQRGKREEEQRKREQEQADFRAYREQMESELALREREHETLRALLGEKNWQTRWALAEVERLRAAVADLRRGA